MINLCILHKTNSACFMSLFNRLLKKSKWNCLILSKRKSNKNWDYMENNLLHCNRRTYSKIVKTNTNSCEWNFLISLLALKLWPESTLKNFLVRIKNSGGNMNSRKNWVLSLILPVYELIIESNSEKALDLLINLIISRSKK